MICAKYKAAVVALLKEYPWLIVVLALSAIITVWAATRRAPPAPEPVPPAVEPAVAVPAPEPEPETPMPPIVLPPPPVEPEAPAPPRVVLPQDAIMGAQRPDGSWDIGPGVPKPGSP
jgi:hypothetical protein